VSQAEREQRLLSDLEALRALKNESTIFDFEASGDPPDRYLLTFRGKGLCSEPAAKNDVKTIDFHQCDLRLPYSYPERPPDIRWITPVLHPNISFSGCINARDIGIHWTPEVGLDSVCERLWDIARLAFVDADKAVNYSAKNWFEANPSQAKPVDPRPLRDRSTGRQASGNVVRYERHGQGRLKLPAAAPAPPSADILFIGDDPPPAPVREAPPRQLPRRRPSAGDGDILYIEE
jgi:ubiquitin-protein ligase